MVSGVSEIKALFGSPELLAACNERLGARQMPLLRGWVDHRRLLKGAGAFPLAAIELGEVSSRPEGAGGLRSLRGQASLYLAFGAGAADRLLSQAPAYADALREAVEATLTGEFQVLRFAGTLAEGEVFGERGAALRLVPVRFEFVWLHTV